MTCMAEDDLRAVERRMELADAKLGVAKDFGWVTASFAAVAGYGARIALDSGNRFD